MAPPENDGSNGVIVTPLYKTLGVEYSKLLGERSLIVIDNVAVLEPPLFVPVTTYEVIVEAAEGTPLIFPVDAFKIKPAGSVGAIEKVTISPPELVAKIGVKAAIGVPTVKVFGVV